MGTNHIDLAKVARRMILLRETAHIVPTPHELTHEQLQAAVVDHVRADRLALTDNKFRKLYWKFIY